MTQDTVQELLRAPATLLLLPPKPPLEIVGSALGLALALEKLGKTVEVVCPTPMLVEANRLVGVERVKQKISNRNLVISFDYVKDAIEKVSYNVEGGKFNLVVSPKPGIQPLDPANVSYSYSGVGEGPLLLVGSTNVQEVQSVFPEEEASLAQRVMSLVKAGDRSLAAETTQLVADLGVNPEPDIVNNLLIALAAETGHFTRASASDFETAASLVRAGASPSLLPPVSASITAPSVQEVTQPARQDWLQQPKIFSTRDTT